ncbi:MAG TPA: MopE-related protein [Kofleriaceae bacterium]|nr:MopE-related protein [Kofleriaceae bacterium]
MTSFVAAFIAFGAACGSPNATTDARPPQRDAPPGSGQLGDDCAQHSDCAGFCVEAVGGIGGVCTRECNDDCPAEWTCREIEISGTAVRACVPDAPQLCLACVDDAECGTGAACLTIDNQGSCATKCTVDCPAGYTCAVDPKGTHPGNYCQPITGSCTCSVGMDGMSRACTNTNTIGTCFGTQLCNPLVGWSTCTALAAALEDCDGNDNDCDFLIDEDTGGGQACSNTVAGIGTCAGTRQCGGSVGYVCEGQIPSAEKCNYADEDCDTRVDETFSGLGTICSPGVGGCQRVGSVRCKADGTATECSVVAGTPTSELCNRVDDNCNGTTDETFPTLGNSCSVGAGTCQRFGTTVCATNGTSTTCSVTAGTPTTELCNALDDNCNGTADETFTMLGNGCAVGTGACQRFGTTVCASNQTSTTCSATAGSPTAELCNAIDDNCNGMNDETFTTLGNGCSAGIGACQRFGTTVCASNQTSTTCSVVAGSPVAELCNKIDDNCNGSADETFTTLGNSCSVGIGACQRFGTTVCAGNQTSTTCSATAGTAGTELCNAVDDNCNGSVDETFTTLGNACSAGFGVCQRFGTTVCASGGMTTACTATAGTNSSSETCNFLDDDCNGVVDNGFRNAGTGVYDQTANCGSCGNDCAAIYTGANSAGQCSTATGSPTCVMVCSAGTSDLNASSFDGCEFVLDNTTVYVSTTDSAAADDATCGLGPTGSGAGNHPCKTITFGLTRAGTLARPNVRVADGTYNESVTLVSGKNVYGGYRSGTWDRHLATTSTLIQGVSSVGVHDRTIVATNVSNAIFEGFVVRGSFNTKATGNSYAIYISGGASTLVIKDNVVFAGRGGAGSEGGAGTVGSTGPNGTGSVNGSYDGYVAGSPPCSASRQFNNGAVFSCGGDNVSGGNGGGNKCRPATDYTQFSGINGFGGQPAAGAGGGAAGGTSQGGFDGTMQTQGQNTTCFLPGPSMAGADGASGMSGSNGSGVAGCSASTGTVSSGEWVNGAAPSGVVGFNGGGGGGGAAGGGGACTACGGSLNRDRLGAHGGGGGAGGCGGAGGNGGTGGGGVFGIFIVGGTAPTLTNNSIQRGAGGPGGDGGIGGAGGFGGRGGAGGAQVMLCAAKAGVGGNGGNGGYGSGGGGGCGGSSYGIFTSGIGTPTYCTNNTVSGGSAGAGGVGGFSVGNSGANGTAGVLQGCTSI